MREYNNQFGSNNQGGDVFPNGEVFKQYLETNVNALNDTDQFLPQNDLLDVLVFMNKNCPKGKEKEFQTFLDSADRDGYTLVHYLCHLSISITFLPN